MLIEGTDKQGKPKLQICLDTTNLNKAIIRELYHFKTPEDISHFLADATVMTVLDCKKGYWHQELDETSSYLTMFNMEFGRYQYTVMLFDTTVMGDVFQRKLDQCFGHLQNVIVIADDIMVIGKQPNHKEHDQALTALLDGHKPAQSKIKAIQEMPAPQCKKQVQSFMGMVNYLSKFLLEYRNLQSQLEIYAKRRYPSTGDQNMIVHSS